MKRREKKEQEQKRKTITQADIMERMRECWERLRFDGKALTKVQENKLDYNFTLINLYIRLTQGKESDEEHLFAVGFEYEDEEENEDDEG